LRLAGFGAAIAVTVAVFMWRDHLRDLGEYGYLGIFLLSVVGNATLLFPAPTFVTAYAAGGLFNPVLVGIVAAAGATLGELTAYLAGASGQAVVEDRAFYQRIKGWMERRGWLTLFVLAATPNPLFDVAGFVAGALRFPVMTFLAVTWVGKILKFWLIAFLGARSISFLDRFFWD
jgi:membrane protein YqaA with SNARE-associated domain